VKLSDVMSAMQLSSYAQVGLVLFLLAFVLIAVDVARKSQRELEHAQNLPLEKESSTEDRKP
jgi:hypothetical protein